MLDVIQDWEALARVPAVLPLSVGGPAPALDELGSVLARCHEELDKFAEAADSALQRAEVSFFGLRRISSGGARAHPLGVAPEMRAG
jgi:hypothetical protein